jgi:ketosteroid isomerase-like protein
VAPTGRGRLPSRCVHRTLSLEAIDAQEERFAGAFAAGDITSARDLYHPAVVYLSPTTRLFGRARRIEGVEATLAFIGLTITGCANIGYRLAERAVLPGGTSAYARIVFDWDAGDARWRSTYVVVYRYRDGCIGQQELYYDPSGPLERLGAPATSPGASTRGGP